MVVHGRGAFVFVEGRRWFVREVGEGAPVVFLHGIPTSSFLWRNVLPVVGRGRRAVAPDLLGFGRSDKPVRGVATVTELVQHLARLLDRLGIQECALVGHDLGGLIAAAFLDRWPERVTHLVLSNTSFRPERWRAGTISPLSILRAPVLGEAAIALARPWMLQLAMRPFWADPNRLDRETLWGYWEPFTMSLRRTLLRMARQPLFRSEDLRHWRAVVVERCTAGRPPLLLAWGACDPQFRIDEARDLARTVGRARGIAFAHASHFLPEERPRALGRVIALFLERPDSLPLWT
ncbi:MAG: alpha/beta fold hydrolase [Thermomicrobium sp.]|nr:alpha/beta fold hydrolase [Thermomicrobium sp.]